MLLDTNKELLEMSNGKNSSEKWEIAPEDLLDLVETGILPCQDYCASRDICGSDACRCIRAIFPYPEAYELYWMLREEYLAGRKNKLIKSLLESINEKK